MKKTIITLASIATVFANIGCLTSHLVQKTGVSEGAALTIITMITGGGATVVETMYPVIIPFLGTLQGLIYVCGTAFVVGW